VRLALAFLLFTPVRTHSVLGARWSEFDLPAARWTIPVERLKLKRKDRELDLRPFVVPLAPTAVAILERLRELAGTSPYVCASPKERAPGEPATPPRSLDGKALSRALSRLQRDSAQRDAPLLLDSRATPHDLRRTWRSWAQDHGVSDSVAALSLGH